MSGIEIQNVTKRFDDKLVLDNISLSIESGEIYGLIGPNGAGKSTLISMITGLLNIDSGKISVGGFNVSSEAQKAKAKIGLVPQEIALYESLNAIDNLEFWGKLYGLRGNTLKKRMDEVLEATGLHERAKDKVLNYSGGMKRRLNIACAVMHHPEIIIMDEPTVGIDPQSRNHILEFTKRLNKEYNSTVIYTSHYMEEVEELCNKVAIIDNGKIIISGAKEDIKKTIINEEKLQISVTNYSDEISLKIKEISDIRAISYKDSVLTILVKNPESNLQSILELLFKNNVKVKNINIVEPNLETLFLSLTGKNLRD